MKKRSIMHIATVLMFIFLPLFVCAQNKETETPIKKDDIRIYDTKNDEVFTVTKKDFLIGAIAAEMPVTFENEALKAQGIAAYTYYKRLIDESEDGAISADPDNFYIYAGKKQLQDKWGDSFDEYYKKLSDIADEIEGLALCYNGELICSTYYAISSGNTECSEDIFGGKQDYLQAVASPWDAYSAGYFSEETFTFDEAVKTINSISDDIDISEASDISDIERTPSGSVLSLKIGNQTVTGAQLRDAFGLRSQNFELESNDGNLIFHVKGYGHGVGMSQVGADYLARQNYSYEEILEYYYPGAEIKNTQ